MGPAIDYPFCEFLFCDVFSLPVLPGLPLLHSPFACGLSVKWKKTGIGMRYPSGRAAGDSQSVGGCLSQGVELMGSCSVSTDRDSCRCSSASTCCTRSDMNEAERVVGVGQGARLVSQSSVDSVTAGDAGPSSTRPFGCVGVTECSIQSRASSTPLCLFLHGFFHFWHAQGCACGVHLVCICR